ncbi:MAG: Gfo/Idh/MocA family protein [Arachnia sp.]
MSAQHRVAILGAGAIVATAHIPAYRQLGLEVAGLWRRDLARLCAELPGYRHDASPEAALADDSVDVVDIATPPGPRLQLIQAALDAGKHVLIQKPAVGSPAELAPLLALAARASAAGQRLAVNQNARWAPAWRAATALIGRGEIGEVIGVTHLHDKPLPPLAGTQFDDIPQMLLVDYLNHWFDITAQWLGPGQLTSVCALSSRTPGQPERARNPWHATAHIMAASGASATLRIVGDARSARYGCPFWVHGTLGTIRGSLLRGTDEVRVETAAGERGVALHGQWFVDGFAAAMGELLSAIDADREPEHNVASVIGATLASYAARDSALAGGAPVRLELPAEAP